MPPYSPLDRDAQYLKGVGPRRAQLLERLGLRTARDVLYHTPRRYADASTITPLGSLETGNDATVIGRVVAKGVLPTRKGLRIFQAALRDRTGYVECTWPGQPFLDRVIEKGDLLLASGPVRFYHGKQLQPREFIVLAGADEPAPAAGGRVIPIYPATEGITHRQIRQIVADNLDELLEAVAAEDVLPESLCEEAGVPTLTPALDLLHRPSSLDDVEAGRRRLAFEELLILQLIHARAQRDATRARTGTRFPAGGPLVQRLKRSLPFALTGAQRRVLGEIGADMESERRMNRLLQGDVGSGKTIVALFAALRVIDAGYQAALMAPTEVLAEQHARTVREILEGFDVTVERLTGRLSTPARRTVLARIASGEAQLVIGTHALIQEDVKFHRLGLAIVDEQHRFGVRQRLALAESADPNTADAPLPDVLVMSATPIPRSLALTLYGDLDISLLNERPPGRRPITTALRRPKDRERIFAFVREQLDAGRQAFIVYPLVEETERSELKAATDEFARLQEDVFPGCRLGLVHGQLPAEEKDRVMRAFADGEIQVLVATTVIEVGIDVPNATVMVVEHAERFGLSQLHQLRGRVGRGADESYCILVSDLAGAIERLRIFSRTDDGFRIAEEDLRLRGQGDLFGARQSGLPEFRWALLEKDLDLLDLARREARRMIDEDPDLTGYPAVIDALERRYGEKVELFRTG